VLAPFAIHYFTEITGVSVVLCYVISRLIFIYLSLVALHVYAREWFPSGAATAGVLGVAALLPLTYTNGWGNPASFPELALFTFGCLCIARKQDLLFLIVLIVATLNRETAVFLVLLWGSYRLPDGWRKALPRFAGYGLVWAAIYVGLRWLRGYQPYDLWMLKENVASLVPAPPAYDPYRRVFGLFWIAFLAIPTALAVRASRLPDTPVFMTRTLPVLAAFLVTCVLISKIIEARIFMPAIPLLLPGVLRAFTAPGASEPPLDARRA